MTTRVYVNIEADSAEDARDQMAKLLNIQMIDYAGAGRTVTDANVPMLTRGPDGDIVMSKDIEKLKPIKVPDGPISDEQAKDLVRSAATTAGTFGSTAPAPQRERGRPSPGHARRTKAEIAEDDAADAADAAVKQAGEEHGGIVADKVIEDDTTTAEQDAADEAAETEAATEGKLTLDSLRNASGTYARKYGVAAAAEDVRSLIGCPLVECPEDKFPEAVAAINEAVEANPFGREIKNGDVAAASPAKPAPSEGKKAVTKQDLIDKMMEYALLYDGQTENTSPAAMPITFADVTECFRRRFGDDTKKLSDLKPEQYEQALLDITSMFEKNPFDRKPVKKAA